ncbi:MAG: pyridoxal-phosphate dependent enzyme [Acidimicrobiales bacterium]|nr:pyridoxal-phosphate dependent enzyme [Acidimicrobiales bacterium]
MDPRRALDDLPSAGVGHFPTPLQFLPRLSDELDIEVWIKRDDVQGVALAGNKLRKFDLVIGQALEDGKDLLVTTGAAQSNSARTGAAAAAAVGIGSVLLLSGHPPATPTANALIDHLVGAEIRFAGDVGWDYLNAGVRDIVSEFHRRGHKPFAAPVGCSSPLGSLGFARAFLELDSQLTEAGIESSCLVHTSTSGGTHAGLLVGRELSGRSIQIIAVDVGAIYEDPHGALLDLARASAERIGTTVDLAPEDLIITTDQLGDGYAIPSNAGTEAIRLLATTEAILLDPVYSGKGFAGFVDMARRGALDGPVVFWHTGGYHALFHPPFASSLSNETD